MVGKKRAITQRKEEPGSKGKKKGKDLSILRKRGGKRS